MISFEQIISRIGNMPIGDPNAMRAYARRLQAEAAVIGQTATDVTGTVDGARYECPAASRLRSGAGGVEGRLVSAANRLNALAGNILAAAMRVEDDQRFWHTEFARVARELEHDLKP
jgi:hypothetical protein